MAERTEIKVRPSLARLKQRLEAGRRRLANTHPLMKRVATVLDTWVQRNFQTEGGKVGGWEPLALSTRLARIRKTLRSSKRGRNVQTRRSPVPLSAAEMKILQDTGRLRASMLPFAHARDAGIGSQLPYSRTHEEGTGHIPRRRILPEQKDVAAPVRALVEKHGRKALDEIGR